MSVRTRAPDVFDIPLSRQGSLAGLTAWDPSFDGVGRLHSCVDARSCYQLTLLGHRQSAVVPYPGSRWASRAGAAKWRVNLIDYTYTEVDVRCEEHEDDMSDEEVDDLSDFVGQPIAVVFVQVRSACMSKPPAVPGQPALLSGSVHCHLSSKVEPWPAVTA